MTVFAYKAKTGPDRVVGGRVQADTPEAAVAKLQAMGYSPVWVREAAPEAPTRPRPMSRRGAARATHVFTRQLAGLLRAGVPILRALATIQEQTEHPAFRRVVGQILVAVRDGRTLSEAMAAHPRLFSELYLNMVRAGEAGGVLDDVLLRLAEAQESDEELRGKVRSALAYPALVLVLGIISVFVILTFFLPRIMHLLEDSGRPLPMPTQIVLAVSRGCSRFWPWMLLALVGLAALYRRAWTSGGGRRLLESALLRLPLIGRFLRDADLVRFTRTLALLIRVGIPIDRALDLSGRVLSHGVLRAAVLDVGRQTVQTGSSLAAGFRRHPQMPAFVTNMVAVGEESGRLDETLGEIASFYQRELDRDLRLATTLLEPALILIVGAVVGFIIFAMLLPIFEIGQAIG